MNIQKIVIGIISVSLTWFANAAYAERQYHGKYVTQKGWARTVETARLHMGDTPKQQGQFYIVLVHEGWNELSNEEKAVTYKRLKISGVLTGKISMQTGLASHVFVNKSRSGMLYSQDDVLTPEEGDFFCSQGIPLKGVEEIKITQGTGMYAGIVDGRIFVEGVVNMCETHKDFRKNTFDIQPAVGYLEFN